jgi:hypothetical protein
MRRFRTALLLVTTALVLPAQTAEEEQVIAVMQKVFDGIAAHDAAMIESTMLPDARLSFVRDQGTPASIGAIEMANRISLTKGTLLERFNGAPRVLIRGRIAQLWAEYEFLRDGKFSHCGIDTATLLKTETGWKIASLSYTAETTGCNPK